MVNTPTSSGFSTPALGSNPIAGGSHSLTTISGQGGSGQIPTKTTRPKELLRHDISDEELVIITNGKREGVWEALWAFAGGAIGSASPAIQSIYNGYFTKSASPISLFDLLQIVIFFLCLGLTLSFFLILQKKGRTVDDIVAEIRTRKKS